MQWPIPPFPVKAVVGTETSVSANSANTKGNWITLLTLPAGAAASWLSLGTLQISQAGDRAGLMDIAIGGAGSETIVAADLVVGYRDHSATLFPLHIPAGATIRARLATALSSMNIWTTATAYCGEPESGLTTPGRITTYGTVPATSSGTHVTPSGSMNVKGSWAELAAATTSPIHALMVLVQSSTSAPSSARYAIDIGIGGAGSETVIVPDHHVRTQNSPAYVYPQSPQFVPLSMCIPAGVRLAARCAVTSGSVTTPIEVAVYGFTY
ncbi:hypothetical protein [Nonomuraea indica]|uniref:hypothetical protein n=1 Tax=Nonomuraea indica TaxID=1581193 RepID=UPI000C7CDF97|nr:hypothetical protein [Nonomuraea indica]